MLKCEKCGRETSIRYFLPGIAAVTHCLKDGMWVCASCVAKSCGIIIPMSLTEKLPGAHYIRLKSCSKQPIDKDWPSNPMFPDNPVLKEHLAHGGNYGVVGGNGLVIVDADTQEVKDALESFLPETFTVESPGSNGWHCYFKSNLGKPIRLRDENGINIGDVQGYGKQVVGPGCFHPNGSRYKIVKDKPLAIVSQEKIREALSEWTVLEKEKVNKHIKQAWRERLLSDVTIRDVVSLARMHRSGNEYFGSHPVHGSKTGRNFWVNPSKNVWHCFRHDSGGGPLLWIAVEEGILSCAEASPGALKGEIFKRVIEAVAERGFKVPVFLKKKIKFDGEVVEVVGSKIRLPSTEYKLCYERTEGL